MRYAEPLEADRNLFILDTKMLGVRRYGALYILKAPKPAIIETGFSHTREKTLAALDELKIRLEDVAYICPTHVHMDHAGGAGFLAEACPNARLVCHHLGAPHLIDPSKLIPSVQRAVGVLFPHYGTMKPIAKERVVAITGGERFDLGDGYLLEGIDSPGHATHHACFYEQKTKGLFTGDAVGIYRPEATGFTMTTPPPAFHYEESLKTLERLRRLELEWLYFTHYGAHARPHELIDEYEAHLRAWVEGIIAQVREQGDPQAVKEFFVQQESRTLSRFYEPGMLRQEVEMNVQGVWLYLRKHHPRAA
jgi:glyoxylase-like metal-dependent hydrolase (beta-lactamase superfamily II)